MNTGVFSRIRSSLGINNESIEDNEEDRNDNVLVRLLDLARKKFNERSLDGIICISINIGTSTRSVSCDMKSSSYVEQSLDGLKIDEDEEELSRLEKLSSKTMDFILNTLEKRALKWKNQEYYKDISLSNESSIQLPFFRILGMSISFSATVESLVISKFNKISGV